MSTFLKITGAVLLCGCCTQGICLPRPTPLPRKPVTLTSTLSIPPVPPMLSLFMWLKFWPVRPGMTTEQVMRLRGLYPIVPAHGERHGWRTLVYLGPLTQAEQKALHGKQMQVDVQIVLRPGPVSVANPPVGSLNPTMPGETIATVSTPYLGDGGALCID